MNHTPCRLHLRRRLPTHQRLVLVGPFPIATVCRLIACPCQPLRHWARHRLVRAATARDHTRRARRALYALRGYDRGRGCAWIVFDARDVCYHVDAIALGAEFRVGIQEVAGSGFDFEFGGTGDTIGCLAVSKQNSYPWHISAV